MTHRRLKAVLAGSLVVAGAIILAAGVSWAKPDKVNGVNVPFGRGRLFSLVGDRSVPEWAAEYGIEATSRCDAPGVYVDGIKLASVGLRIRRGSSFHGLALNVDVDLEPFSRINPCGFKGLELTDLARLGAERDLAKVRDRLLPHLLRHLRMDYALSSFSLSGVPTSLQNPA